MHYEVGASHFMVSIVYFWTLIFVLQNIDRRVKWFVGMEIKREGNYRYDIINLKQF